MSNSRFKDLRDTNMFSFLQQKSNQAQNKEQMDSEITKLKDSADLRNSKLGFLFSSKPKVKDHLSAGGTIGFTNPAFSTANMVTSNGCKYYVTPDKPFSFLNKPDLRYTPLTSHALNTPDQVTVTPHIHTHIDPASQQASAIDWQQVGMSADVYRLPSYWEDLDSVVSQPSVVGCFGIITPEREIEFRDNMILKDQNCWKGPQQTVSYKYYRKSIDMMLMGIEGQVFIVKKESGVFSLSNFNSTVENVSGKK